MTKIPIIVSKDNETRKIEESKFEAETKLQEYIYNNPEILPIEEIEEEIPFISRKRSTYEQRSYRRCRTRQER